MKCLLCNHSADFLGRFQNRNYNRCTFCASVFLDTNDHPNLSKEKERYNLHQNNTANSGYLKFLSPLLDAVSKNHTPADRGLDYGSGPNPVFTNSLQRKNYQIVSYDPIYANTYTFTEKKYNYIVCCEVIEHFHNPQIEFNKLHELLTNKGKLYIKTNLLLETIEFKNWWYKNDYTHTFFYTERALLYIKENFAFNDLKIHKDYIVFEA